MSAPSLDEPPDDPIAGVGERSVQQSFGGCFRQPRGGNRSRGRRGHHAGNRHRPSRRISTVKSALAGRQRIDQDAPRALREQNWRDLFTAVIARDHGAAQREREISTVAPENSSSITTSVCAGLAKRVVTRRESARNSFAAIQPVVNDSGPRRSLAASE